MKKKVIALMIAGFLLGAPKCFAEMSVQDNLKKAGDVVLVGAGLVIALPIALTAAVAFLPIMLLLGDGMNH